MALGELERSVMSVLWGESERTFSVRDVAEYFRDHAYTTIMTVLSRLHDKGYVVESKSGRANVYRASTTKEEYVASLMGEALSQSDDRLVVLSHFAANMDDDDRAILARLMRRRTQ